MSAQVFVLHFVDRSYWDYAYRDAVSFHQSPVRHQANEEKTKNTKTYGVSNANTKDDVVRNLCRGHKRYGYGRRLLRQHAGIRIQ